jgi:plasmid stability protein
VADMLIRNLPDEVLAAIDAAARRLGLSRNEFVRRRLGAVLGVDDRVTVDDLARFAEDFADLADAAVMARAWE